jgi:competence protein ComFC
MAGTKTGEFAKSWLDAGLGFLYPAVCQICGKARATPDEGYVCADCRRGVRWVEPPFCERCGLPFDGEITTVFECGNCREMELHFLRARAAVAASGIVLDVIHRYKYQHGLWFEPFLAGLLVDAALPALNREKWNLVMPVPLHPLKKREREYNQAERLARCLSIAANIPVDTRALHRVEPNRTQTRLDRAQRAANVKRAFAVVTGTRFNGERIVLVDDVLTTGATTSACALMLKRAGAGDVCVWTVARGLLSKVVT